MTKSKRQADLLPACLRSEVFGFLTAVEFFSRCRLVCVLWKDSQAAWSAVAVDSETLTPVLDASLRGHLRCLSLAGEGIDIRRLFQSWPRLRRLQLSRQSLVAGALDAGNLEILACLEELTLLECSVIDVENLSAPQLKIFKINKMGANTWPLTVQGIETCLLRLVNLQVLELSQLPNLTSLEVLPALPNLRTLGLGGCSELSDRIINSIVQCRKLDTLNLMHCARLTSLGISGLAAMTSLRSLILTGTQIDSKGLALLLQSRLQVLNVSACSNISGLPRQRSSLRSLTVRHCDMSGDSIGNLCEGSTSLTNLDASYCFDVPDSALRHLGALDHLQELKLWRSSLKDLPMIASLQRLRWQRRGTFEPLKTWIHLKELEVEDIYIGSLGREDNDLWNLPCSLQRLTLELKALRDGDLKHLAHLQLLRSLTIRGAEHLKGDGFEYLLPMPLQTIKLWNCKHLKIWGLMRVINVRTVGSLKSLRLNGREWLTEETYEIVNVIKDFDI